MADCFVSYKCEDRARVEGVVAALREAGHSVWWDREIGGGAQWRKSIATELERARCVLVCWTSASVDPAGGFVHEEAECGKKRGVLLPVLLDRVRPPIGFNEIQALDLVGWDGRVQSPQWQAVERATTSILEGKAAPSLAVARRRRLTWAGGALTTGLACIGIVVILTSLQYSLCKLDKLTTVCRWVGLGPSAAELAAWHQAKSATTSEALKAYLATYSAGAFAAEAQARLAACKKTVNMSWSPYEGGAPIVVPMGPIKAATSQADARRAMDAEVQRDAEDACSAAPLSELYRPIADAKPDIPASGWQCRSADGGWRCRYDGKIICHQEKRQSIKTEVCPVP
jgi:hypothetical protein